ncbi:superkiller complex protein 3 [Lasioglossum baleicum]|uniref:superkiller complex protein 3 n=1 Tax=Lasioglossum baleicum TaxID=434251 RepID=UPI003FCC9B42
MSDETKAILKEAYQLLRQKEYSSVVKKCKKILRKNENHFDALLVLACAMLSLDEHKLQVPMVLEKAMQIKPDSPKPWQGLITYYEENLDNNESRNKLISSYCKLLHIDSNKFLHNLNKILEVSSEIKDDTVLGQSVESLYELRKKLDDEQMKTVNATLAEIIVHSFDRLLNNHQDLMESVLSSVVNDTGASNRQNYYGKYLKVLYDKRKSDTVIEEAANMHRQFPNDKLPLEYICRVYYEYNILNNNCYEDVNIKQYYESLITLEKDSHDAAVARAVHLKKTNDLLTARQILKNILAIKPRSLYGWITLSEISVGLYCWEDAENAMRQATKLVNNQISNESLYKMELILIESLSRSSKPQKWKAASQMCKDLLSRHPSTQADLLYARIHILLDDDPEVSLNKLQDLESKNDTKIQASLLRALYFKHQHQLDFAIEAVNLALELPEAWLLLGSVHYEREQYNHSLMAFLNGVTADQFNWECLVYLGHYYREHGNDLERSRRCYLKALQINPNSEEAGIGLSTVYRLLKNYSANMQLLERLTAEDGGPKWAWFQLGKQYLDREDGLQAIKAFQRVIRADPNNSDNWEALGDAYFIRGAYTSALRSYQRALELCPTLLYSLTQLATIKLILEQYTDAKDDFEQILLIKPQYVSALKGLAEVCIALANESAAKQFLGRVNDYLQQALNNLALAITERNDMSCLWKLLGDVCYKVALLPEKYNSLSVPSKLIKNDDSEGVAWLKRRDLFLLSTRCYCCALSISSQSASLWHDLASCYLMQLKFDPTVDQKTLASKCLAVGKHAVKLCPSTWLHWNLLGVICMSPHVKNYALAQHSYVMAIDRELNNPVVWCNLGTLYLHIGDLYKANEAYSQAQRADPAYINSWIGQAIIAEMMARKEAIDLFRHSTQLGYHNEAALGYAHWVLTVLLTTDIEKDSAYTYIIENMHALFVASDVITWYLEYYPEDRYARNAYGLLLERQKLYRSSAEQFAIAIHTNVPEEKDAVCLNLGRVLIQLKKYSEAIKLFEAVRRVNYNSQCHLALSLYKAGKYEESYSAYETTLHSFAKSETEKAYTLCAMAAIAYTFQGVHDAKTLLFQSIQIQPQVVTSFLAAAALGILHGDLNLTTLILNELKSYESHRDYGHHVANLTAYFHLIKTDVKGAVSTLSKAIFNYPDDVRYWIQLLRILLETDVHSFSRCAQKALFLNRNIVNTNAVHVACASSFNYFEESSVSDPRCSVRSAQKLLFTYPDSVESWATFIVACLPRPSNKNITCDAEWLTELILVTQRNHKCTASMAKWLDDNKTRLTRYIDLKTMMS